VAYLAAHKDLSKVSNTFIKVGENVENVIKETKGFSKVNLFN